jgi:hypothetical protein
MPGMAQQPSGLARILQPEVALPMAAALLGNQGNMQNFGNAFGAAGPALQSQKAEQKRLAEQNKTVEFFKTQAPEFASMIESGMPVGEAWQIYTKQRYDKAQLPASVQEFQYGLANPEFNDWQTEQKRAGATNVTVGGGKYGTIPQGFMLDESDPAGARLVVIPGGPEDTTKKDTLAAGQADVATRVVTSAATRAREAAKNRQLGGFGQGPMSNLPWTDSAEVARQVEVLKSTAKVENLTAMRAASPTGGALGSVTEKEADMLAAKSGALDPSSPTFERDLDDYELTLLQVVHGPQEGSRIWQQTRQDGGAPQGAPASTGGGNVTKTGVQWSVGGQP